MIDDFASDAPSPDSLWSRARHDYAAGESASAVCERYRLTRSTFFARAKAEGWRRADGGSTREPDPYVADMEAALVIDLMAREATPAYALARRAWALAEIALMRRRRLEAQSWIRVARDLRKLAMEEAGNQTWRRTAQLGEEAAAKPQAAPERDEMAASTERLLEGSLSPGSESLLRDEAFEDPAESLAPPLRSGGGGAAPLRSRDGGGALHGACEENPAQLSPAAPSPPQDAVPLPRYAGEEKKAERDDGLLPMSILADEKKLRAFFKEEFGWPRDPLDSADQFARTADSVVEASPAPPPTVGAPAAQ